jgi:hypothetical protein
MVTEYENEVELTFDTEDYYGYINLSGEGLELSITLCDYYGTTYSNIIIDQEEIESFFRNGVKFLDKMKGEL